MKPGQKLLRIRDPSQRIFGVMKCMVTGVFIKLIAIEYVAVRATRWRACSVVKAYGGACVTASIAAAQYTPVATPE